jgi:hypothetical protein
MDDFIKRVLNFEKVNQIYENNLFTVKSISQYLGLWENLSTEEKNRLETLTSADSLLNGHIDEYSKKIDYYKSENKSENLGYGEITKSGTNKLYNYLKSKIEIKDTDTFYDIGSGNGKMVIHFGLISNFKMCKGVEIEKIRYLYSLDILKRIGDVTNVQFINDDVLKLNLSDAKVVFMNDTLFSKELIFSIFEKLNPGTHIICLCLDGGPFDPIGEVLLDVSWMPVPIPFKHYIK